MYYVLQFATFAILILAANTAYADFPRLCSIIASDGFLPRQLANRGDRLVFSNGIVVLAVVAGAADRRLRWRHVGPHPALRRRRVHRLHAVARPAWSCTTGGCGSRAGSSGSAINAVGAVTTGIVLLVVVVSKFTDRRLDPGRRDPDHRGDPRARSTATTTGSHTAVEVPDDWKPKRHQHTVVVLVGNVHRGVLEAITYARSLAPDRLVAVSVVGDAAEQEALAEAVGRASTSRSSCTRSTRRTAS